MPSSKSKGRIRADSTVKSQTSGRNDCDSESQHAAETNALDPPEAWPTGVWYSSLPVLSPWLSERQLKWLYRKPAVTLPGVHLTPEEDKVALPVISLPLRRSDVSQKVLVSRIDHSAHPAHGQYGLVASRNLYPGELVIPYIGYVHSSTASEQNESEAKPAQDNLESQENAQQSDFLPSQISIGSWDTSDYDLNMVRDEDLELAVDAGKIGNEARFCNDYRGVPLTVSNSGSPINSTFTRKSKRAAKTWNEHGSQQSEDHMTYSMSIPNAEFRDVWFQWSSSTDSSEPETFPPPKKKVGMRGVGIFVLPAGRSGKRKSGIAKGQEILVSYGKGFWAHHGTPVP